MSHGTIFDIKEFAIHDGPGIRTTFAASGGKPLAQPAFFPDLTKELSPLHITLDTCGYAPLEIFKNALKLVNFEHTDPHIHKAITGVDNESILKNFDYLCSSEKKFVLRIPYPT